MKEIIIFDLDDTLINSAARICVVHKATRQPVEWITPSEFNTHIKESFQEYDYTEFDSPEILRDSTFIPEIFQEFLEFIKDGRSVSILTARNEKSLVTNFLKSKNIFLDEDLVFTVGGNSNFESIPMRKVKIINQLIGEGYDSFILYDDNINNLNAINKIEKSIEIKNNYIVNGKKEEYFTRRGAEISF